MGQRETLESEKRIRTVGADSRVADRIATSDEHARPAPAEDQRDEHLRVASLEGVGCVDDLGVAVGLRRRLWGDCSLSLAPFLLQDAF